MKTFSFGIACVAMMCGIGSNVAYSEGNDAAAVVISTIGTVDAIAVDKTVRPLKRGSKLFALETVSTKSDSKVQFRYANGDLKALEQNTTVIIDSNLNKGSDVNDQETTLLKGALRSLTGAIRSNNPSAVKLRTNVAVTGVRGTLYRTALTEAGEYLAVDDGAAYLENGGGTAELAVDGSYHLASASAWETAPEYWLQEPQDLLAAFKPITVADGATSDAGELELLQDSLPHTEPCGILDDETWATTHRPSNFLFGSFKPFDFAYKHYFSRCSC